MRCAERPGRALVLAALLAGASLTATSPANAQPEASSLSLPDEAPATAGVEATPPATDLPAAESPAPAGEASPYHPPGFPKMILLDTGHVLGAPLRWKGREWLFFSASTAAIATLSVADESLSDAAREHGPTFGAVGDVFDQLGGGASFVLLGGFYLAGMIGKDSKAKNVCLDGLSASLLSAGIITPVLATVIGRERPTEEQGAYSFHPFEARSFPSGHTTQAFAVASVIATSYDQLWVKITAYGAATMTAWARVRRGKHFPTDVVAGALIGTVVGRSVVHFNRRLRSGEKEPEVSGARLTFLPVVGEGLYGVSATLEF
ncbi:MAG: phosphatase PAP2 family protein [Holophagales bacterium]|nr:phosphatase PAP2 family protein [Holophagales bacterium]